MDTISKIPTGLVAVKEYKTATGESTSVEDAVLKGMEDEKKNQEAEATRRKEEEAAYYSFNPEKGDNIDDSKGRDKFTRIYTRAGILEENLSSGSDTQRARYNESLDEFQLFEDGTVRIMFKGNKKSRWERYSRIYDLKMRLLDQKKKRSDRR